MSKTSKRRINFYDPQNIKAHSVFFFLHIQIKLKKYNKLHTQTYINNCNIINIQVKWIHIRLEQIGILKSIKINTYLSKMSSTVAFLDANIVSKNLNTIEII